MYSEERAVRCCAKTTVCFVCGIYAVIGATYLIQFAEVGLQPSFRPEFLIFFPCFIISFCSYVACALSDPGIVSNEWALAAEEAQLGTLCATCNRRRPERAHHCSVTGKCILKFDHYCPWVGNTVGHGNYKFFYQMIVWGALGADTYVALLTVPLFLEMHSKQDWTGPHGQALRGNMFLLAGHFLAAVFAAALTSFGIFHGYLLGANQSTLECGAMRTRENYSVGFTKNCEEVCGPCGSASCWFPVKAKTPPAQDGYNWVPIDPKEKKRRRKRDSRRQTRLDNGGAAESDDDAKSDTLLVGKESKGR